MRLRLLTTLSVGLLAAACQAPYQQRSSAVMMPPPSTAVYSTSEQACSEYGFDRTTAEFDRCVSRERSARQMGRVDRNYAEARLNADARDACTSYGLQPGTMRYNTCINREVDARVYRDSEVRSVPTYQTAPVYQTAPAYRVTQDGVRVDQAGYRVDAYGNRM
jgi:hypothetical protein